MFESHHSLLNCSKASSIKTRIETLLACRFKRPHTGSKASSIKTRIETVMLHYNLYPYNGSKASSIKTRIETNSFRIIVFCIIGSKASSIKTRIETVGRIFNSIGLPNVLKQVPLKQGLKHCGLTFNGKHRMAF